MAVKLRLRRMGRTHRPLYAVVAADARAPRDGRFIEDLGRYRPLHEPAEVTINHERALYWLQNGAQPTDTVRSLLSKQGVMYRLHLLRKGKSEEEIEQALTEWFANRKEEAPKLTAAQRRQQAMDEERKKAEAEAAEREAAQKKAEAEAKKAEAEAKAEEARLRADAQAKAAAAEANAQAANAEAADSKAAEAATEGEAAGEAAAPEAVAEVSEEKVVNETTAAAEEGAPKADADKAE